MTADLVAGGASECRFNGLERGVNADLMAWVGGMQIWWLGGVNADLAAGGRNECRFNG